MGIMGVMNVQINQRRTWAIDQQLAALVDCPVRVRVESFTPGRWKEESHFIQIPNLILPDGTKVERDPVYFEGMLKVFTRRVAVVHVELDTLPLDGTADGRVLFRGVPAVILRAPATVQLHHSQFVERLPTDEKSYWQHLIEVDSQMNLPFADGLRSPKCA